MAPSGRLIYAVAALAGALIGIVAANFVSAGIGGGVIAGGPWSYSLQAQPARASLAERAAASSSALTLERSEAIEFIAETDSEGAVLTSSCAYQISGIIPVARFWSLAVYNGDGTAVNGKSVAHGDKSQVRVTLGGEDGLAAGEGEFRIVLRLFNPASDMAANPQAARLPSIKRGECK